jgi:universal stress protein A
MIALKTILVATDFGEAADAALSYGRALARTFGGTLHLLHVTENQFLRPMAANPHDANEATRRRLTALLGDHDRRGLDADVTLETSDAPAEAIVEYAARIEADLIVMGTHGRTGLDRLLTGSVAEHVVRTAPCPVLTVRSCRSAVMVTETAADAARA